MSLFRSTRTAAITAAALATILAAVAPAFSEKLFDRIAAKRKESGVYDLSKDPASQVEDYVKTKNLEALKGLKRVVIPYFQVEFAVENKASAVGGGAWVKASGRLSGVDQTVFESIADGFNDKLVADLKKLGIEVVPYEALKENGNYQKMKAKFRPSPHMLRTKDGYSLFYGPHGMPVYFRGNDDRLGGASVFGEGFSTVQPQNIEPGIGKDLDAAVLRVRMSVDIAKQHTSSSTFGGYANAETRAQLGLMADWTMMEFITPGNGTARVWLGKYVNAAEPVLELVKNKEGTKFVDLSALGGSNGTDAKYAIVTTTEDYTRVVNQHLAAVQAMFLSVVKSSL